MVEVKTAVGAHGERPAGTPGSPARGARCTPQKIYTLLKIAISAVFGLSVIFEGDAWTVLTSILRTRANGLRIWCDISSYSMEVDYADNKSCNYP